MAVVRILQIFTKMDRGGAESMIMNYYRHIDRSKVQFDFLVHREGAGHFDSEIEALGGNIYRIKKINPFFPKQYYTSLRLFFKSHTPYKFVHSHLNTFSSFPLKIASEFKVPYRIAHAHIALRKFRLVDFLPKNEGLKETLKKLIKLQLRNRIHLYTTHYFSCGKLAGKWLFGKNIPFQLMNNAIDTKKFVYDPVKAKIYKNKFNLENKVVIGHIGRFATQKNHLYLVNIFHCLLKDNTDYCLVLVGDGPLMRAVKDEVKTKQIEDKVLFLGVREDIPQLYQMMDLLVFPSLYEGLPVTLIEAQAAGLPIFASDQITTEVVITNLLQFMSITQPTHLWADKILNTKLIERCDHSEAIGKSGFDIVSNAQQIQHFYLQASN